MSTYVSTDSERGCQALLFALAFTGATFNALLLTAGLRSVIVRRRPFHVLKFFFLSADLLVQLVVSVSTAVSLHTGTRPDSRPLLCQVASVLTLFGTSSGLSCATAIALSRYLVIVKQQQLTRRQYSLMVLACLLIALGINLPIIMDDNLAQSNQGHLICLVKWADSNDSKQLYVTILNIVLWGGAMPLSLYCYCQYFQYVKKIKLGLSHSNAVEWSSSAEIVQFKRLFFLTVALCISWSVITVQVWLAAITGHQVPSQMDQMGILSVTSFFIVHSCTVLWINLSFRHALMALLCCRRHGSIQPNARGSGQWSVSGNAILTTAMQSAQHDTVKPNRMTMSSARDTASDLRRQTWDPTRKAALVSPSHRLTAALDRRHTHRGSITHVSHDLHCTSSDAGAPSLEPPAVDPSVALVCQTIEISPSPSPRHRLDPIASAMHFNRRKSIHDASGPEWLRPGLLTIDSSNQHSIDVDTPPTLADATSHIASRKAFQVADTLLRLTEPSPVQHVSTDTPDSVGEMLEPLTRASTHVPSEFSQQHTDEHCASFDSVLVG